ncbi:MAG: hypothetical protein RL716_24 [Actinomycetota bacterium]|jgi:hypothetical protein
MNLDAVFEDLEAKYAAQLSAQPPAASDSQRCQKNAATVDAEVRVVEVLTARGIREELIAPLLGKDFIAGMDLFRPVWVVYKTASLASVEFKVGDQPELPKIRFSNRPLDAMLDLLPKFGPISWRLALVRDAALHAGQFIKHSDELLFVQTETTELALPIEGLEVLRVESVDNFGGDFANGLN